MSAGYRICFLCFDGLGCSVGPFSLQEALFRVEAYRATNVDAFIAADVETEQVEESKMALPRNHDSERALLIALQLYEERVAQLQANFPSASEDIIRARARVDVIREFDDVPDYGKGEF